MSADNDLDYWARMEDPNKKELKRAFKRACDASSQLEAELCQLCARGEALVMSSRQCRPEQLAKLQREREVVRAKIEQVCAEKDTLYSAILGEPRGALALLRGRDEARKERDRLRELVASAYRRGAEAMREACAEATEAWAKEEADWSREKAEDAPASSAAHAEAAFIGRGIAICIRDLDLPIPEER